WQRWDFYTRPQKPVSVASVWNPHYEGIHFPKKVTTVLRVKRPAQALYWRATTLDVFDGRAWMRDRSRPVLAGGHALPPPVVAAGVAAASANVSVSKISCGKMTSGVAPFGSSVCARTRGRNG